MLGSRSPGPAPALKKEAAAVRPLILSCTLLLHTGSGHAQAGGRDRAMHFVPLFYGQGT